MNEPTPAPNEHETPPEHVDPSLVPPPAASGETPVVAAKAPLPNSVLILGGVALALLVTVLVVSLAPKQGSDSDEKDKAAKDFQAEIQLLKENNERLRTGMGLAPSTDSDESAEKVAARIKDDTATLAALAKKASEMIGSKDGELASRNKALADSLQVQKALSDQIAALRQELNGVNRQNGDLGALQAQLGAALDKVAALSNQVQELRQAPIDLQNKLTDMTLQRDSLERQVRELRAKLAKINIFAGSEADIVKEAQALYRSLVALEGQPQTEIGRAYSQYATTLSSTALDRVAFATGSAELDPGDIEKLRGHVEASPDNAVFFVVGYASKTGSADDNRKLSSARATAVANALADLKKPEQRVQAAYLGQTDRFGVTPPEANQVCELWQITPRE